MCIAHYSYERSRKERKATHINKTYNRTHIEHDLMYILWFASTDCYTVQCTYVLVCQNSIHLFNYEEAVVLPSLHRHGLSI